MSYPYYYTPQYAQHPQQTPMLGQAGPSTGYMPIYAPAQPAQAPTPFIPPASMLETPPAAQPQPLHGKNRPKHSRRAATTPLPLKSALKKPGAPAAAPVPKAAPPHAEPVQARKRVNSRAKPTDYVDPTTSNQISQQSDPGIVAYHMFVTFKGDSELLLENIIPKALKELKEKIFSIWHHGIDSEVSRGYGTCKVKFRNAPWDMSGPDTAIAWKLIRELFALFAKRGYTFQTSTNCTTTTPRLIFAVTTSDSDSSFFLGYLSRGGRRITLINPPHHIAASFGPQLRSVLPNQVEVHQTGDIHTVEVKREIGGTGVQPPYFLMLALKAIAEMGFDLNATVPMARGGPLGSLGMGPRRELYVFKGVMDPKYYSRGV